MLPGAGGGDGVTAHGDASPGGTECSGSRQKCCVLHAVTVLRATDRARYPVTGMWCGCPPDADLLSTVS